MPRGIEWNWTAAAFGAALAVLAAIVTAFDPESGLAIATGMLPAALLGLLPRRRARGVVVLLGVLTGASIAVGGLLSGAPVPAVAAIFLMGVGLCLLYPAAAVLAGTVGLGVFLHLAGAGEERWRREKADQAYLDYLSNTGRYFPRFISRPRSGSTKP